MILTTIILIAVAVRNNSSDTDNDGNNNNDNNYDSSLIMYIYIYTHIHTHTQIYIYIYIHAMLSGHDSANPCPGAYRADEGREAPGSAPKSYSKGSECFEELGSGLQASMTS